MKPPVFCRYNAKNNIEIDVLGNMQKMRYIKQGSIRSRLGVGLIDPYIQLKEFDFNRLLIRWCSWFLEELLSMSKRCGYEEVHMIM